MMLILGIAGGFVLGTFFGAGAKSHFIAAWQWIKSKFGGVA